MAPFEKIIAGEEEITDYIPQRPPMVMISKLLSAENGKTTTSFVIREDNLFCEGGLLREPGLIENMAQTAAAGNTCQSRAEQRQPRVGYIGGIRNLRIYDLPGTGSEIITEVLVEHEVFDATVVSGKIFLDERIIAECELKIFILKQ